MAESRERDAEEAWVEFVTEMNEAWLEAVEQTMAAQADVTESWLGVGDDTPDASAWLDDGLAGYAEAYRIWMEAAEEQLERTTDAVEGEPVPPEDFRDIWLKAANEAFSEVMSTTAFAATVGQTLDAVLELQQQADEATEETLSSMGLATGSDIEEVGQRIVETERRLHAVEGKLDQVLTALEEDAE